MVDVVGNQGLQNTSNAFTPCSPAVDEVFLDPGNLCHMKMGWDKLSSRQHKVHGLAWMVDEGFPKISQMHGGNLKSKGRIRAQSC